MDICTMRFTCVPCGKHNMIAKSTLDDHRKPHMSIRVFRSSLQFDIELNGISERYFQGTSHTSYQHCIETIAVVGQSGIMTTASPRSCCNSE